MKKKILVITVLLLTFAFISIPVMAAPATKIEGIIFILDHVPTSGPQHFVDHTIIQTRGGTSYGTVTLLGMPGGPLVGTWDTEWSTTAKSSNYPDPEGWVIIREKAKMIFTGQGTTGTFEGMAQWKWIGTFGAISHIEYHMVLQGTGDFKGQTLKITGAFPPLVQEVCLIIPK